MAQKKLSYYFENPDAEYHYINLDLKQRFHPEVYQDIITFVQLKTDEAMDQVTKTLMNRYEKLTKIDAVLPNNPTKEDRNKYIKEFFELTNPKEVSKDLKAAFKFHELDTEYRNFAKKLKTQEYGELFKRYNYPTSFFNSLKQSILHHINLLTDSLQRYTEAIGKHIMTLNQIYEDSKGNAFIKGGASLLGMLVGIPFAGAGLGALMRASDKDTIESSLKQVFDQWNLYIDDFNKFQTLLNANYRLAVMTIYGGTLLRVNDQLNVYNYTFETMSLADGEYTLTLTEKERKATEKWIKKTISGISQLILNKDWKESINVSLKLFQIIKQRPILGRTKLYEEKSTLYIAHTFYYLAYQEALLEEYKNGHKEQFFKSCKLLYQELPLLIQDKDIDSDFSKQGHLLFRFIKEGMKNEKKEDLKVILFYLERIIGRWETAHDYIGEVASSLSEIVNESKAFFAAEAFLEDVLDLKTHTKKSNDTSKTYFTTKQLRELRKIDKEIDNPDILTQYLKSEYIKSFFFPWRNFSFKWMVKYRKKIIGSILGILLILSSISYGPQVIEISKEKISGLQWFSDGIEQPAAVSNSVPIFLTLTVEQANVRDSPSLEGNIITTVSNTDEIHYLEKDQTDSSNTKWHNILLPDGKEGWISGAISKKQN